MKLLFIGGTGLISSACSDLAVERGHELFIVNRSTSALYPVPEGATVLQADVYADEARLASLLAGHRFDAVVDFLVYTVQDIERDIKLFREKTEQFIFISSASAYQKPPTHYLITEETPLENPFWGYSRDKIACEERLMKAYQEERFPITIIRPSLTYGTSQIPLVSASWSHPYTVVDRMKRGKKVIIPGDGTSLWVLTWNADFAKGLIGLLGNNKAIGEAFHITSDEVLTWNQIFLEVYQALSLEPNIMHISSEMIIRHDPDKLGTLLGDKVNSAIFDNSKIKRFVPEFSCEVNWAEGLRRCLTWFESHPEFRTVDEKMNNVWDSTIAAYEKAFPEK
ncbi:MAG: NAD-dependent epimerase/dehydratase family protein [Anaerolineae bacterium]|nr:NAD-dependent epimerase/dehydratase family protein [Anaerolineae bacterium]MCI0607664.1 NAD-dependent epimerase/dehydratase family protein [Anaerolineae bacterium]